MRLNPEGFVPCFTLQVEKFAPFATWSLLSGQPVEKYGKVCTWCVCGTELVLILEECLSTSRFCLYREEVISSLAGAALCMY